MDILTTYNISIRMCVIWNGIQLVISSRLGGPKFIWRCPEKPWPLPIQWVLFWRLRVPRLEIIYPGAPSLQIIRTGSWHDNGTVRYCSVCFCLPPQLPWYLSYVSCSNWPYCPLHLLHAPPVFLSHHRTPHSALLVRGRGGGATKQFKINHY